MGIQARRTNKTVSTKLALTLFDNQILPILLYGSPTWSLPTSHNFICLSDQSENGDTRGIALRSLLDRDVPFTFARRVGKTVHGQIKF